MCMDIRPSGQHIYSCTYASPLEKQARVLAEMAAESLGSNQVLHV